MNRFIDSPDAVILSRILGLRPRPAEKHMYSCCPSCDDGYAVCYGWIISAPGFTGRGLKRELGIMSANADFAEETKNSPPIGEYDAYSPGRG